MALRRLLWPVMGGVTTVAVLALLFPISGWQRVAEIQERNPSPVCGNGKREPGEKCDDGNAKDGDGCSYQCGVEQGWECRQAVYIDGYAEGHGINNTESATHFTFRAPLRGTLNETIAGIRLEVTRDTDPRPRVADLMPAKIWKKAIAPKGYYEIPIEDGSGVRSGPAEEIVVFHSAQVPNLTPGKYTARVKVSLKDGTSYYVRDIVGEYVQEFSVFDPAENPRLRFGEPNITATLGSTSIAGEYGTITVTYTIENSMYLDASKVYLVKRDNTYQGKMNCVQQGTSSHSCSVTMKRKLRETMEIHIQAPNASTSDWQFSPPTKFTVNPDATVIIERPTLDERPSSITFSSWSKEDLTYLSDRSKILIRTRIISDPPNAPFRVNLNYPETPLVKQCEGERQEACFYVGDIPTDGAAAQFKLQVRHATRRNAVGDFDLLFNSKSVSAMPLPLLNGRVIFYPVPLLKPDARTNTVTAYFTADVKQKMGLSGPNGTYIHGMVEVQNPDGSWISSRPFSLLNLPSEMGTWLEAEKAGLTDPRCPFGTCIIFPGLKPGVTYRSSRLIITAPHNPEYMRWQEVTPITPFTTPSQPTANLLQRIFASFFGWRTAETTSLIAQVTGGGGGSSQGGVMGRDWCTWIGGSSPLPSSSSSVPSSSASSSSSIVVVDHAVACCSPSGHCEMRFGTTCYSPYGTYPTMDECRAACRGSSSSVSVSSSSSTGRPSDNVIIVDDLDAAPGFTFSYPGSNKFERSNGFRWHSTVGGYWRGRQGANELRATFRFAGVPAGRWKLFATWAKHAGDVPSTWNTRVKYYVDGNVNVAEMLVDQRSDPVGPDLVGDGAAWQSIGSITMDGRPIDVVLEPIPLQYEEGGMIMADAVAMVRDGGGGTSAISSWMPSWLRRWFSP